MQAGQIDCHGYTSAKRGQQGIDWVFSGGGQQQQRRLALAHLAQAAETLAVHQVEEHLLALWRQTMHLVQK